MSCANVTGGGVLAAFARQETAKAKPHIAARFILPVHALPTFSSPAKSLTSPPVSHALILPRAIVQARTGFVPIDRRSLRRYNPGLCSVPIVPQWASQPSHASDGPCHLSGLPNRRSEEH